MRRLCKTNYSIFRINWETYMRSTFLGSNNLWKKYQLSCSCWMNWSQHNLWYFSCTHIYCIPLRQLLSHFDFLQRQILIYQNPCSMDFEGERIFLFSIPFLVWLWPENILMEKINCQMSYSEPSARKITWEKCLFSLLFHVK